jgi:hypothetical protein
MLALPAVAFGHHGEEGGHLPPVQQNMELVGELELNGEFGDVVPGQIADLAVHKGHAYLNSWDEPSCTRGGTYIADISDPTNPQEVGFLPANPGYYHGEGAHVIEVDTPQFTGDLLAVNDEACTNAATRPADVPTTAGGFDLYDVTDPANPVELVQNAGDRSPDGSLEQDPEELANSYHSVFVWQDGPRAFLVASDNTELADIDIFDITDPENPEFIADFNPESLPDWDTILDRGAIGAFQGIFNHDMIVKQVGDQMRLLVSYWDAGYIQLDVDDPEDPTYITDTNFPGADPLTGFDPPEGNAHQAEYSHDNALFLAADEDFTAFRLTSEITEAPFEGYQFAGALSAAEPIPDGETVGGDTEFVGDACDTVPAPSDGVTVALAERGGVAPGGAACGFQLKIDNIEDAGYELAVIFNNSFGAGGGRCETLIGMTVDPETIAIPAVFVGRADAFRILGTFDEETYQCTGGATEEPTDTDAPPAGTQGLTVEIRSEFDGWGYAHLYDAETSEELGAFAIPEALDPDFAAGFGDLSIHEFAADPEENLAYSSYYSGGMRVFSFDDENGLTETGAYIDDEGSNFWGVEQYTTPEGRRLIAGSDRDFGLQIFCYTGPSSAPASSLPCPEPRTTPPGGGPGPDTDPPETTITKKPKKASASRRAKFSFASDEPNSRFECKLDKGQFKSCDSPFKKKVDLGKHRFKVRAIDAAGNVDRTPASYKWKVEKKGKGGGDRSKPSSGDAPSSAAAPVAPLARPWIAVER